MRLLICMWWCRCGVDDGFGIMVVSGCREYVTEPVDMVLVVTGRMLYVVGWAAAYYVRCCGGGLCWGASSMIVLMILVEYTTRVVTLCACVIILCWSGCDYFQCDREIYVSCVLVVRVLPRSMAVDGCMLVPVCIVFVFRICVYECVCMMVCVFVYWCAYVHAYVRICMCV